MTSYTSCTVQVGNQAFVLAVNVRHLEARNAGDLITAEIVAVDRDGSGFSKYSYNHSPDDQGKDR